MTVDSDLGGIEVKELGRFNRQMNDVVDDISSKKTAKRDIYDEISIELEGISELTNIDSHKFIEVVKKHEENYGTLVEDYRGKILSKVDYPMPPGMADSLVEVMIGLNLLKDLVFEAGGYEKAVEYACKRYGVSREELTVKAVEDELKVAIVEDKFRIRDAFRVITSFCGPELCQDIFSLFVIANAGKVVSVNDASGRIVGVVQLMVDKWGDSYMPVYSVLKSYRDSSVASILLDAAEENAVGRYVSATRSLDMIYNIRNMLDRGYVARTFIPDFWGEEKPRIVLEKDLEQPAEKIDFNVKDIPSLTEYLEGVEAFSTPAKNTELIDEALNRRGFELVDFLPSDSVEDEQLVLVRTDMESIFNPREFHFSFPEPANGLEFTLIRGYDDIYEAIGVTERYRRSRGESVDRYIIHKNYPVLKIISYVGLVVGLRDEEGRLAAFASLLWDKDGGICFHTLSALPEYGLRKPRLTLLEFLRSLAEQTGRKRAWFIHSMQDAAFIETVLNETGFDATSVFIDPFGNGHDYLLLESNVPAEDSKPAEPGEARHIRGFIELRPGDNAVLASAGNHELIDLVLGEGFRLTSVVDGTAVDEPGEKLFLFRR